MPWVDVPDISNVPGAFDPANDPYAAYADDVIASLDANVSGNQVIGRATFIAIVRAWRTNQAALQKAILARMSISQAETNAFLSAQNKVTSYVQKFVNASGWFLDAPIPLDVRADVDGPLKNLYGFWPRISKIASMRGMQAGEEIAQEYRETMRSIVHGASRVAIGFVPFVGTAMDLCEAVTGKEWCMPSGRELTTGERIFSGIGFGVGKLVKVWKGVGSAADITRLHHLYNYHIHSLNFPDSLPTPPNHFPTPPPASPPTPFLLFPPNPSCTPCPSGRHFPRAPLAPRRDTRTLPRNLRLLPQALPRRLPRLQRRCQRNAHALGQNEHDLLRRTR